MLKAGLRSLGRTAERLRIAVRAMSDAGLYLSPAGARVLLETEAASRGSAAWERLDGNERELLARATGGCTATRTGGRISLPARKTLDRLQHLIEMLELRHRSDAVSFALRAGLLRVRP